MRNPKRRSGSALQNLAEVRAAEANAPASWSAAVLRRFRWAGGLGIRAVRERLLDQIRFFGSWREAVAKKRVPSRLVLWLMCSPLFMCQRIRQVRPGNLRAAFVLAGL